MLFYVTSATFSSAIILKSHDCNVSNLGLFFGDQVEFGSMTFTLSHFRSMLLLTDNWAVVVNSLCSVLQHESFTVELVTTST